MDLHPSQGEGGGQMSGAETGQTVRFMSRVTPGNEGGGGTPNRS